MAQRRCYGCMGLTDQPVCGSCGTPEEEQNLPHQLPRGTSLAGRFLVGKALGEFPDGISYLALDQSLGEPVKLLEFYPANAARRDGTSVEPDGAAFARRKVRFCRVSEALSRDSRLTEVSGTEMTFEENGTCYRVCEQVRGSTLKKYVEMQDGSLHPEEVFRILDGVMEALEAFHKAGFSHGKLDWESIVLDSRGGPRLPRIGENPGEDPREDVGNLCRIILNCLGWESKENPGRAPELTARQRRVLRSGLSQEPGADCATAGALREALLEPPPAPPVHTEQAPPPPERPAEAAPVRQAPAAAKKQPEKKRRQGRGPGDRSRKTGVLVLAAAVLLILAGLGWLLVRNIHVWKEADCGNPRTCLLCGAAEGEALGHDWEEATCQKPKTCARCGAIEGAILGHDWEDASCESPRKCRICGATEGEALGHDWEEATCRKPRTCARCGATEGEPLGHDWGAAEPGKPQVCSRCGEVKSQRMAAMEGAFSQWVKLENAFTHAFVSETPVCYVRSLTLHFTAELHSQIRVTRWKFYFQTPDGEWVNHGTFTLEEGRTGKTFTFEEPADISAVAVVPASGGFTYDFTLAVTDVCYEDRTGTNG